MIASLQPGLCVRGQEFIPTGGPCVVTFNHYYRPGFQAWWLALAVAACLEPEMHWVVTNELTCPGKWYGFIGRPLSRWVLKRLADLYSFTGMPPMPPRPQDAPSRAAAVRRVLAHIKYAESPILGLAPEGQDDPTGLLRMPSPGAGRFGLLLASAGLSFVPVGAYEDDGQLCLRFGPAYDLKIPDGLSSKQKDPIAALIIMKHIAELLPASLRGEFE